MSGVVVQGFSVGFEFFGAPRWWAVCGVLLLGFFSVFGIVTILISILVICFLCGTEELIGKRYDEEGFWCEFFFGNDVQL